MATTNLTTTTSATAVERPNGLLRRRLLVAGALLGLALSLSLPATPTRADCNEGAGPNKPCLEAFERELGPGAPVVNQDTGT